MHGSQAAVDKIVDGLIPAGFCEMLLIYLLCWTDFVQLHSGKVSKRQLNVCVPLHFLGEKNKKQLTNLMCRMQLLLKDPNFSVREKRAPWNKTMRFVTDARTNRNGG